MKLSENSVKRPITVYMFTAVLVILGAISFTTRLGMLAVSPLLSTGFFRAKSCKSFRFEITFQVVSPGCRSI